MTQAKQAAIALTPPSARDLEVQEVADELVAAFAWRELVGVLRARLKELDEEIVTHSHKLFLEWSALDPDGRPDFLTFAHNRRG